MCDAPGDIGLTGASYAQLQCERSAPPGCKKPSNSHPRCAEQLRSRSEGFVPTLSLGEPLHPPVHMGAYESIVCKSGGCTPANARVLICSHLLSAVGMAETGEHVNWKAEERTSKLPTMTHGASWPWPLLTFENIMQEILRLNPIFRL